MDTKRAEAAGTGAMYFTTSTALRARRPQAYLTPLLTAEAGQQWGRKEGSHNTVSCHACHDTEKAPKKTNVS